MNTRLMEKIKILAFHLPHLLHPRQKLWVGFVPFHLLGFCQSNIGSSLGVYFTTLFLLVSGTVDKKSPINRTKNPPVRRRIGFLWQLLKTKNKRFKCIPFLNFLWNVDKNSNGHKTFSHSNGPFLNKLACSNLKLSITHSLTHWQGLSHLKWSYN